MLQKIKLIIRKLIAIQSVRNRLTYLLARCLPRSLFLKLKRCLSYYIYKDKVVPNKYHHKKKMDAIFRIVPFCNQRKKVDLVFCCAFEGGHEILEQSIMNSLHSMGDYQVEWFICGSTEEDHQFIQCIAAKTGIVSGMLWRNNPLEAKRHFCLKAAGDLYDAPLYVYEIKGYGDIISSTLIHSIITDLLSCDVPIRDQSTITCLSNSSEKVIGS